MMIIGRIIRPSLTSYDIICATPRTAPNKAYFELEDHPAVNKGYTANLDTDMINKKDKLMFNELSGKKATLHNNNIINKNLNGEKWNINLLAKNGLKVSLIKSFIPSANGCNIPTNPTILGPLRNCI